MLGEKVEENDWNKQRGDDQTIDVIPGSQNGGLFFLHFKGFWEDLISWQISDKLPERPQAIP